MDPRLLDYYNRELAYLRQLGGEFAENFPKVAGRLSMSTTEVADPYVERLLEGCAFLTARVQIKMDAEFPRFSQRLLEVAYPNYLAPTPAMAIVRFAPSPNEGSLAAGFEVPRHTQLRSQPVKGEGIACEFRTAHSVSLWPLKFVAAKISAPTPDLPLAGIAKSGAVRSVLRLAFETTGGVPVSALALDRLSIHLAGTDDLATRLMELLGEHAIGLLAHAPERPIRAPRWQDRSAIRRQGFADDQALLPYDPRSFQGYRLLHEYFAFPQRFYFFSLHGLQASLKTIEGNRFELSIALDAPAPDIEGRIDQSQFALYCTPAINLFPKRSDRLPISTAAFEHHVYINRTRPLDYEIYAINGITGYMAGTLEEQQFGPFFAPQGGHENEQGTYFSMRREPRMMSDTVRRHGPRTGYVGSEIFISLVDQNEAPYREDLKQITLDALCSNRDLPLLMPLGGETDFSLNISAPISSAHVLRGPSKPAAAVAEREITWRLIDHLHLNYLTLTDLKPEVAAETLRSMLGLYSAFADPAVRAQISGLTQCRLTPITRRLPITGPLVFGRGVEVAITVDENAFAGASPYLFGAVLSEFFTRHVAINSFVEIQLSSAQRGVIGRWKSIVGRRAIA
jgi:type VI secretion system protein ImpG